MTKKKQTIFITLVSLVLVNIISVNNHHRWDVTKDQHYTISTPTRDLLHNLKKDIIVSVFLTGDLPFDFERLKRETTYFLEELSSQSNKISFVFVHPQGKEDVLIKQGLTPSRLTVQEDGKTSESVIFPYAIISYGKKKSLVNLLKDSSFENQENQIENSIQNLEFAFANGIQKATAIKKQKIAILKGNGEIPDIYQYDWIKTLGNSYHLAQFTLDSVATNPTKTLTSLQEFDLVIISKPTIAFTEKEKFTLDQYTIHGGKSIWLLDMVNISKDSLMSKGKVLAYQRDLNLTDYLFNYGVRFKKHLVKDLYAASIPLGTGKIGNNTQFKEFLWDFYPLIKNNNKHVISKNIGDIKLEFANSIDTLNSNIQKTPLLESSKLTKVLTVPNYVNLASITKNSNIKSYNTGSKLLGVLLEGNFKSAYRNRIKPYKNKFLKQGSDNKMIVIADGDMSSNQISQGEPLELGLDKWSHKFYSNKEFLMNAVNYLLNDNGVIQLRAKKVKIDTINKPKAYQEKLKWQLINSIVPVIILSFIGFLNYYRRKRKF